MVGIFLYFRNDLRRSNDHLLRVLSDSVRAAMLTEDMINKHLDELILENSKTESGAGIEPSLSELATSIRKPEGTRQARVGSEETPTGGLPLPFPRRGQ